MNKVVVRIMNSDYTLKGQESEEYLNQIGFTVNRMIENLIANNKKLNIYDASILTACNLADEKLKNEKRLDNINQDQKDSSRVISDLSREIENLKLKNQELLNTIDEVKLKQTESFSHKDEEIKKLNSDIKLLQDSVYEYKEDNERFSKTNKELKFELQSYKYKVLDLQNKLFETQMSQTKEKKNNQ